MIKNKKFYVTPVLCFLVLILFFAFMFLIPISSKNGISFLDSLFLSTSAVSGTGLSTLNITDELTLFGKIIVIIAIQLGALGLMIYFSFIVFLRNKKINLSNTLLLSNEINLNSYSKVKERTFKIVKYTMFLEFIGAMLLAIFFIPEYGVIKGIWYGIFHSISAFCNAGFDILGSDSLIKFKDNIPVNIIIMFLMLCGSIGYFVIDDVLNIIKGKIRHVQLHSKIIIVTTFCLIVSSTIFIKILNPNLSCMQALFTSFASRSTGFCTVNMENLNRASKLIITIFMFIGGAAGSTAGGIKVTNFAILLLLPISAIKDEDLVIGCKKIDFQIIKKSITIVVTYIILVIIAFIIMLTIESFDTIDLLFELVSAFTTTGLATFDVNELSIISKIIIIVYMYIGRLGPLTFLTIFTFRNKKDKNISYPSADLMI